ncbi:hypothetical protein ABZ456_32350 [Streptomyces sp. NPDC005776]|uniref:hypothetical protein n=1 Tax=Streptomyces sp. NPDC005776 TaxID=3154676 RepID=UPI0033C4B1FC
MFVLLLGGDTGMEDEHRSQSQTPSGERDGELLSTALHGLLLPTEQGAQARGVLTAQREAQAGQERGDDTLPIRQKTRYAQRDPVDRDQLGRKWEVLLAVTLHDVEVLDIAAQLRKE